MSVVIRLSKTGKTHSVAFRIVTAEKWSKRDGRAIEILGFYDPHNREDERFKLDKARYDYWISKGAKPSEAVEDLVKNNGVKTVKPKKKKVETQETAAPQAPAPAAETTEVKAEEPKAEEVQTPEAQDEPEKAQEAAEKPDEEPKKEEDKTKE